VTFPKDFTVEIAETAELACLVQGRKMLVAQTGDGSFREHVDHGLFDFPSTEFA
jgi:hypothetical protein